MADVDYSLNLSCVIITFVVVYLAQQVEDLFTRRRRQQIVFNEREIYFDRLTKQSDKINNELCQELKQLEDEGKRLRNLLGADYSWGNFDISVDEEVELLNKELDDLRSKKKKLQSTKKKTEMVRRSLEKKLSGANVKTIDKLEAENRQIESILDNVRPEVRRTSSGLTEIPSRPKLGWWAKFSRQELHNKKINDFLDKHEHLTCDTLGQMYDSIIKAKALGVDFKEHVENFRKRQPELEREIADLAVEKKRQEIELQNMKDLHKKELMLFIKAQDEYFPKISDDKNRLNFLQKLNTLDEKKIARIKVEIDRKKKQLETERNNFEDVEKQYSEVYEGWTRMKEMLR